METTPAASRNRRDCTPHGIIAGRYTVTGKQLGEGGFSVVYPATDCVTGEEVALKVGKDPDNHATHAVELKTLEELQGTSPYVCKLFPSGLVTCRDGVARPFIAMQVRAPVSRAPRPECFHLCSVWDGRCRSCERKASLKTFRGEQPERYVTSLFRPCLTHQRLGCIC